MKPRLIIVRTAVTNYQFSTAIKNGPSAEKLKFSSRGAFRKKNLPLCCLGSSENIALSRPIKISVWYRFPAVANRSTKHRHSSDNRIRPPLGKRTRQRQQLPVARSWLLSNNKGYCLKFALTLSMWQWTSNSVKSRQLYGSPRRRFSAGRGKNNKPSFDNVEIIKLQLV